MTKLGLIVLLIACNMSKDAVQARAAAPAARSESAVLDYTTLATTASGKALFAQLPDATSPEDAIRGAVRGLPGFDRRPTITGAFVDTRGHRGGGSFTGTIGGQPVSGTVFYGVGDRSASVAVVYVRADAPAAERAQLAGSSHGNSRAAAARSRSRRAGRSRRRRRPAR